MGFQRVESYDTTQYEVTIPTPTAQGLALILEAIRNEGDADSFLGSLAGILQKQGFNSEAIRVLHYPSIFCPCVTHETRTVPDFMKVAF